MKPRTVLVTLELHDCTTSLALLRRVRFAELLDGTRAYFGPVAQSTAQVAQPSTPAVRVRVQKAAKRKGRRS